MYVAMYPDLDNPGGPVRLSKQPTHTASRVYVSDDGTLTLNEKVLLLLLTMLISI